VAEDDVHSDSKKGLPLDPDVTESYVPHPDDFAPSPPKPPTYLSKLPAGDKLYPVITLYLMTAALSVTHWRHPDLSAPLIASRTMVFDKGEITRLVTSLFIHSDIEHFLANTPLFIVFGWLLYAFFGGVAFPVGAIIVGALANAATLAFYPPEVRLIGASGMIYGMVGMWLTFFLRLETAYRFRMRLMRVVGFILVLLFPTTFQPTTSYLAHAMGFFIGVVAALLILLTKPYAPSPLGR
jgi:rhomboid protease GluP